MNKEFYNCCLSSSFSTSLLPD